ncbi:hypothetical protein PS838_06143 [Pseudomonas fluorescens]|nr:hypothetical protein PS838_06143 [Pseudomonas fluorescens]
MLFFLLLPLYQNADSTTFLGKVFRSLDELKFSNYMTDKDINENWRGYESYRGWTQYLNGELAELIFGQGFGTSINLGLYINLGGSTMNEAPVLHNGYIYLLVKCGFIGVALYIALLIHILKSPARTSNLSGRMISAITIFVIFETFTSSGLLGKSSINYILILFGMLIRIQTSATKNKSQLSTQEVFCKQQIN